MMYYSGTAAQVSIHRQHLVTFRSQVCTILRLYNASKNNIHSYAS